MRKLSAIGVSEFILALVFTLAVAGAVAVSSSSVTFRLAIAPPPPPTITTILGDSQSKAVLVIGKTEVAKAVVRVYAFSTPIFVETTADDKGDFYAAFTSDLLPPGFHQFTAAIVLGLNQTTDPSPKIFVEVSKDYVLKIAAGNTVPTVKIGNADAATSELLRSIIRNQQTARPTALTDVPPPHRQSDRARLIQLGLLVVIVVETSLLMFQRWRRKKQHGQSFWHLGHGWYPIHPGTVSTPHQPGR
ncbi:MAG: hypothetical protein HY092_04155 [Candidatus Kerfeldbacteria bacterium]|nr:hypothetical protein [Candidatus Kerfeldbacteria bacterium]